MIRILKNKLLLIGVSMVAVISLSALVVVWLNPFQDQSKKLENLVSGELDVSRFQQWVVYNNKVLNFSIEIPPEWTINEERDAQNNPTGNVSFTPSTSASPSSVKELRLSFKKYRDKMASREEFENYKQDSFSSMVDTYQKVAVIPTKNGDAILFSNTASNERLELLSWLYKDQNSIFILSVSDGTNKEESIYSHRYLLNTLSF